MARDRMGMLVPVPFGRYAIEKVTSEDGHRLFEPTDVSESSHLIESVEARPDFISFDRTYTVEFGPQAGGTNVFYRKDGKAKGKGPESLYDAIRSDEAMSNFRIKVFGLDLFALAVVSGVESGFELTLFGFHEKTKRWRRRSVLYQGDIVPHTSGFIQDRGDMLAFYLRLDSTLVFSRSVDLKAWTEEAKIDLAPLFHGLFYVDFFSGPEGYFLGILYRDPSSGRNAVRVFKGETIADLALQVTAFGNDIGPFPEGVVGQQLLDPRLARSLLFTEFDGRTLLSMGFEAQGGTNNFLSLFKLSSSLDRFVAMPNADSKANFHGEGFTTLSDGRFVSGDTRIFFFGIEGPIRNVRIAKKPLTATETSIDVDASTVGYALSDLGGPSQFGPSEMSGTIFRDQLYLLMRLSESTVTARSSYWSTLLPDIAYESDWHGLTDRFPENSGQNLTVFSFANFPLNISRSYSLVDGAVEAILRGDSGEVGFGWSLLGFSLDVNEGGRIRFRAAVGGDAGGQVFQSQRATIRARYGFGVNVFDWSLDIYEGHIDLVSQGQTKATVEGDFTKPTDFFILLKGAQVEVRRQNEEWGGEWESLFTVGLSTQSSSDPNPFLQFGHFGQPGSSRWYRFAFAHGATLGKPEERGLIPEGEGTHYLGDGLTIDIRTFAQGDAWEITPRKVGGEWNGLMDGESASPWKSLHDRDPHIVSFRDLAKAKFAVDSMGLVDHTVAHAVMEAADKDFSYRRDSTKRAQCLSLPVHLSLADDVGVNGLRDTSVEFPNGFFRGRKLVVFPNTVFDKVLPGHDDPAWVGISPFSGDICFIQGETVFGSAKLKVKSRVERGGFSPATYAGLPYREELVEHPSLFTSHSMLLSADSTGDVAVLSGMQRTGNFLELDTTNLQMSHTLDLNLDSTSSDILVQAGLRMNGACVELDATNLTFQKSLLLDTTGDVSFMVNVERVGNGIRLEQFSYDTTTFLSTLHFDDYEDMAIDSTCIIYAFFDQTSAPPTFTTFGSDVFLDIPAKHVLLSSQGQGLNPLPGTNEFLGSFRIRMTDATATIASGVYNIFADLPDVQGFFVIDSTSHYLALNLDTTAGSSTFDTGIVSGGGDPHAEYLFRFNRIGPTKFYVELSDGTTLIDSFTHDFGDLISGPQLNFVGFGVFGPIEPVVGYFGGSAIDDTRLDLIDVQTHTQFKPNGHFITKDLTTLYDLIHSSISLDATTATGATFQAFLSDNGGNTYQSLPINIATGSFNFGGTGADLRLKVEYVSDGTNSSLIRDGSLVDGTSAVTHFLPIGYLETKPLPSVPHIQQAITDLSALVLAGSGLRIGVAANGISFSFLPDDVFDGTLNFDGSNSTLRLRAEFDSDAGLATSKICPVSTIRTVSADEEYIPSGYFVTKELPSASTIVKAVVDLVRSLPVNTSLQVFYSLDDGQSFSSLPLNQTTATILLSGLSSNFRLKVQFTTSNMQVTPKVFDGSSVATTGIDSFGYTALAGQVFFTPTNLYFFLLAPAGSALKRLLFRGDLNGSNWILFDVTASFPTLVRPSLLRPSTGGMWLVGAKIGTAINQWDVIGLNVETLAAFSSPATGPDRSIQGQILSLDVFRMMTGSPASAAEKIAVLTDLGLWIADVFPALNFSIGNGIVSGFDGIPANIDFIKVWAGGMPEDLVLACTESGSVRIRRSLNGGKDWSGASILGSTLIDLLSYANADYRFDPTSTQDPQITRPVLVYTASPMMRFAERSSGEFGRAFVTEMKHNSRDLISYEMIRVPAQQKTWYGILERGFGALFSLLEGYKCRLVILDHDVSPAHRYHVGEVVIAKFISMFDHPVTPFGEEFSPNLRILDTPTGLSDTAKRGGTLRSFQFEFKKSPPSFFSLINRMFAVFGLTQPWMILLDVDDGGSLIFHSFDSGLASEEGDGFLRDFGFKTLER